MAELQAWISTWLDPRVVGEAVDKYGVSIPVEHRFVPPAQLIASK